MKVSRLNNVFDTKPRTYLLKTILTEIQRGTATLANLSEKTRCRTLADATAFARQLLYERENKEAYDLLKKELPQFTPACVLSSRSDVALMSGLVCLEFDDVPDGAFDYAFSELVQSRHCLAAWRSLRGDRFKALIPVELSSTDDDDLCPDNFVHAWVSVACLFQHIGESDAKASQVTQPQALSFDADLFVNWHASPVEWSIDAGALNEMLPQSSGASAVALALSELPTEHRDAIAGMEWKPDGWGRENVPCPFTEHEFDGWGLRSNGCGVHRNAENDYTLHCLKCGTSKRYRVPRVSAVREGNLSPLALRQPVPDLPVDKERPKKVIRTLQENYRSIQSAFDTGARVTGLRAGTGEGKTESAISLAVEGESLTMSLNTVGLAEQVHRRFFDAETFSYLWRSRWFGYTSRDAVSQIPLSSRVRDFQSGAKMCIKPHVCEASQDKGIPAPVGVCRRCDYNEDCRSHGYLSQYDKASVSQVLCIAHPSLFIDRSFAGFFSQVSKSQDFDHRYFVIDEAKAVNLFSEYQLSKSVLQQWVRDWNGEPLGVFADAAIDALEKDCEPYRVVELVESLTEKEINRLYRDATLYRLPYSRLAQRTYDKETKRFLLSTSIVQFTDGGFAYVALDWDAYESLVEKGEPVIAPMAVSEKGTLSLSFRQMQRAGAFRPETEHDFDGLPVVSESQKWTVFQQLRLFGERYQRAMDAPISYAGDVLSWYVHPIVHPSIRKLICMGASLYKRGFERAFDSVDTAFVETSPVNYVDGARAFQCRSGKYPRTSLLEYNDNYTAVTGLKPTTEKILSTIETEIERDRAVRHVVISLKKIVELTRDRITEKHENLIDVLSFEQLEGLDFTESGIVFWILGCPDVDKSVVAMHAKILFGNDSKPLNYDYDNDAGRYVDDRVHYCWQSHAVALMNQAVGRARLNRLKNTVLVYSNILIPDFTDRAIGFVPEDLQVAGAIDGIVSAAEKRAEYEKRAAGLTGENTVKEFQDAYGCSERWALELWKKAGGADVKAVEDAELVKQALELKHNQGLSIRKIASKLGLSRGKVERLLKVS